MDSSENWIPYIGQQFDSIEQAWNFWEAYGRKMGFDVRKKYNNTDKNKIITSSRFVCSKEGFRQVDNKRNHIVKNPRAERRTGCMAQIGFVLDREDGKYKVQDFISEHNHILHSQETAHLMSTHRKISEVQALAIELADASGIKPKAAHELHAAQVGGSSNLNYTHRDHKNYLRSKRQKDLMYGEAGSLLKYFHLQTVENPSFQYSIQLDSEEQITNIFWADAKMLIDYALFGDVFAFDTTFGTNKENRPLGVFVGFNHFREVVVFGAALLYDETAESFKWLFKTFIATHDNKMPQTIFTDQDIAMGKAIAEVMPNTWHGLCTWHIMQNATKHLLHDGSNVLRQFKACMYDYGDEESFEEAFTTLRSTVTKSAWLDGIYALRKKWAECYMSNVFSLGMRSTQLSESFNKDLKDYLQCNLDIMRFFKQFERVVRQKRENEIISEYESREKLPRIKLRRSPLLQQAGQVYTPKIFEAFQDEYEWSTAAYIKPCGLEPFLTST
ncbi:hypothetical protein RND81_10G228600 [Saponaria officinalis]|uniref:Protein FAR1-RELATED SEQUENCE n=1 Tax=Saponaria officinalis TaxID=3572 RepID=A0AAW1I7P5_SAPOF